jgi:hypothetical protein
MIKQEQQYLYDISHPINPIALPVNINSKGAKALPSAMITYNLK